MSEQDEAAWAAYHEATASRPPTPMLIEVLDMFDAPGDAIELGCGAGSDSMEMLRRGWRVLAVDQEQSAVDKLREMAPAAAREQLSTLAASFEAVELPPADLVWSHLSLAFCQRERFDDLWGRIVASLNPGGRVACDLWGDRHAWSDRPGTFLKEAEVKALLGPLEVERFDEEDEERSTVFEGKQRWHAFRIIASKP